MEAADIADQNIGWPDTKVGYKKFIDDTSESDDTDDCPTNDEETGKNMGAADAVTKFVDASGSKVTDTETANQTPELRCEISFWDQGFTRGFGHGKSIDT